MKKTQRITAILLSTFLMVSLALSPNISVFAETSGDWGYYVYDDGTAIIESYNGNISDLKIPSTINGHIITEISGWVFSTHSELLSVSIPDGVILIGFGAFNECTNLENITIPDSVTKINDNFVSTAYYNDNSNWKDGILYIGNHLIKAQNDITTAKLNDKTKTIAVEAFINCEKLSSITIPKSLNNINDCAFWNCDNLSDVYYSGNKNDWNSIIIGMSNDSLLSATIHCADGDILPGEQHVHNYTLTKTVAPTCAEKGYSIYACTCGKQYKDDYVSATGKHTSDKGTVTKKATLTEAGTKIYKCTVCGKTIKTETIAKNKFSVKAKMPTVKYLKLKNKNQTIAIKNAMVVSKAQGTVTYTKSSGNKNITINKKTGKITVKKGLSKGNYKVKIKVKASGNANYKAATKTVTVTIKVK